MSPRGDRPRPRPTAYPGIRTCTVVDPVLLDAGWTPAFADTHAVANRYGAIPPTNHLTAAATAEAEVAGVSQYAVMVAALEITAAASGMPPIFEPGLLLIGSRKRTAAVLVAAEKVWESSPGARRGGVPRGGRLLPGELQLPPLNSTSHAFLSDLSRVGEHPGDVLAIEDSDDDGTVVGWWALNLPPEWTLPGDAAAAEPSLRIDFDSGMAYFRQDVPTVLEVAALAQRLVAHPHVITAANRNAVPTHVLATLISTLTAYATTNADPVVVEMTGDRRRAQIGVTVAVAVYNWLHRDRDGEDPQGAVEHEETT